MGDASTRVMHPHPHLPVNAHVSRHARGTHTHTQNEEGRLAQSAKHHTHPRTYTPSLENRGWEETVGEQKKAREATSSTPFAERERIHRGPAPKGVGATRQPDAQAHPHCRLVPPTPS